MFAVLGRRQVVIAAAAVVLLQRIVVDNIPWIGDFLAEVIRMAQQKL